jgi:LPXTG-motif cell wall-anchored protein
MSLTRPAAIVLAALALLLAAGGASAASSTLTPTPPVTLALEPSKPAPAGNGTTHANTAGALPRTGSNLPLELLVGAVLVATGATLRTRRPAGRE